MRAFSTREGTLAYAIAANVRARFRVCADEVLDVAARSHIQDMQLWKGSKDADEGPAGRLNYGPLNMVEFKFDLHRRFGTEIYPEQLRDLAFHVIRKC